MHSPNSTQDNKQSFFQRLEEIHQTSSFRLKQRREEIAANLCVALAEAGLTRSSVAQNAGISPAQLSKQLSGDTNLTIDSIGRICDAMGWDFDIVFRRVAEARAKQCWESSLEDALIEAPVQFISMPKIHKKIRWENPSSLNFLTETPANSEWNVSDECQSIAA